MSDVRELVDGSTTVRIAGLDAKATSLGTIVVELDGIVADGVREAKAAVVEWDGRHAETFVSEVNPFLVRLARLVETVRSAKQTVAVWPEAPWILDTITAEIDALGKAIEVPAIAGVSAADPAALDRLVAWCVWGVAERVPSLVGLVDLEGVTAEVIEEVPVDILAPSGDPYGTGSILDLTVRPFGEPSGPLGPVTSTIETTTGDPASYVSLPDLSGEATAVVEKAGELASFTSGVAFAFRECLGDGRLIELFAEHPELVPLLVSGLADGEVGAGSALVIVLAYFDEFDGARTGETDGDISMNDIAAMMNDEDLPEHVREAAAMLYSDPTLFDLVVTVDYPPGTRPGSPMGVLTGNERLTRDSIETFLEFNEHLAVLHENFAEFDTAAHPDGPADGVISARDLEALAGGAGPVALAAAWLLAHPAAMDRVAGYDVGLGPVSHVHGEEIVAAGVARLAVDQHVYADAPDRAAWFVDQHFDDLLGPGLGATASPGGMGALFDNALTESDQGRELMDRTITKVAAEGQIHNSGLPLAFANGAAEHMDLLDENINTAFPTATSSAPDDAAQDYLDTHDFLREVSRDPAAADRVRQAVGEYGMAQTTEAPESGQGRIDRLKGLGRLQAVVTTAQDNALTDDALDTLRQVVENGPGPNPGSLLDTGVGEIPLLGTANEIAGAMGIGAGDGVDWLLDQAGVGSEEAFAQLEEAERIDQVRNAEDALNRAVWLAEDQFASRDPSVRGAAQAAAAGQPFLDDMGRLKPDRSESEEMAFRVWATNQTSSGAILEVDGAFADAGVNDVVQPDFVPHLSDRR